MADWVVISSLATAGGTLGLAATTYASVRSANRAARAAELSMLAQLRPLLLPSSPDDPPQRIGFVDGVGVTAPGGCAGVEVVDGRVYLGLSLRNVGTGIAVLHGAHFYPERRPGGDEHAPPEDIRRLARDLYIAPGKLGFWQTRVPRRRSRARGRGRRDRRRRVRRRRAVRRLRRRPAGDYALRLPPRGRRHLERAAGKHWQIDRSDPR